MNVIDINEKLEEQLKKDLLEVLDEMREQVKAGKIVEFVAASADNDGSVQIHVCSKDILGSVGLFEVGKHILITQES